MSSSSTYPRRSSTPKKSASITSKPIPTGTPLAALSPIEPLSRASRVNSPNSSPRHSMPTNGNLSRIPLETSLIGQKILSGNDLLSGNQVGHAHTPQTASSADSDFRSRPPASPGSQRERILLHPHPHTHNLNASGKALVFRDSFAENWYPLLGLHFKEVVYVRDYNWDWLLIEREKPNVVIDEILERFLNIQDPTDLVRKDQLPATCVAPKTPLIRLRAARMWPLGSPGRSPQGWQWGRLEPAAFTIVSRIAGSLAALRTYCKADIERLCPNVEPGDGQIKACLMAQKEQMSVGCAEALREAEEAITR